MSAEHRPPTMAFVVLVVLAIAVIGVHRAEAGPVGEVVVAQAPPRFTVNEDAPVAATPMPFLDGPVLPAGIDPGFADDSSAARTLPATSTPTGSASMVGTSRVGTSRVGTTRMVRTGEQTGTSAPSGATTTVAPTTAAPAGPRRHGSSSTTTPGPRSGAGPRRTTAHAGSSRPDDAGPSRRSGRGLLRSGR